MIQFEEGGCTTCKDIFKREINLKERVPRIFADLENELVIQKPEKIPPKWRIIFPGIYLNGICKNFKCEAYNKEVVCPWGFRPFVLERDLLQVRCPMCSDFLQHVNTCGFFQTYWRYSGIKFFGSSDILGCDWKKANDSKKHYKFVEKGEGIENCGKLEFWRFLTIEAITPEQYKEEFKEKKVNIFLKCIKPSI